MRRFSSMLEGLGCTGVVTYLNSGNAVLDASVDAGELGSMVDGALHATFGSRIPALIKTADQVVSIADSIPAEWVNSADEQTYVAYLFADVDSPELLAELPVRKEYLRMYYTPGAIVWNIKRADYNRSHITKLVGHSAYARMTTRNVNTARRLASMCRDAQEETKET